jgi:hypothetical protein
VPLLAATAGAADGATTDLASAASAADGATATTDAADATNAAGAAVAAYASGTAGAAVTASKADGATADTVAAAAGEGGMLSDKSAADFYPAPATEADRWAWDELAEGIESGLIPRELQSGFTQPAPRAAVAQLLANMLQQATGKSMGDLLDEDENESGKPGGPVGAAFSDTSDENVLAASALGLINGTGGGKFSPDGQLTRAQLAAIISRAAALLGYDLGGYPEAGFSDVQSHWARDELPFSVAAGIFKGTGENMFSPDLPLKLEELCVAASRAVRHFAARPPGGGDGFVTIRRERHSTALAELDLSERETLRDYNIAPLRYMPHLSKLDLSYNQISGLGALAGLANLEYLDSRQNAIADIGGLAGLANLTYLDLSYNGITDISALAGLTNLEHLDLGNNSITDISALAGLANLKYLDLSFNGITDISGHPWLADLEHLDLRYNRIADFGALAGRADLLEPQWPPEGSPPASGAGEGSAGAVQAQ